MIKISNLHYELTEDDIYDLLNKVGVVRSVRLDYDISGRSIGTAIANFNSPYEAEEAVRRFDGRKAAGVVISVELFYYNSDRGQRRFDNRGPGRFDNRGQGRFDNRGPNNNTRRRDPGLRRRDHHDRDESKPNKRGERAPRRAKKTLEELDAELTSYMNGSSGDAPENDTNDTNNNSTSHDTSSENPSSSIQSNNFSTFGDSSSNINNNDNAGSSAVVENRNDLQSQTQREDDSMVLD